MQRNAARCITVHSIATRRCTLQQGAARARAACAMAVGAAHRGRVPIRIGSLQQRTGMQQRTALQRAALLQRAAPWRNASPIAARTDASTSESFDGACSANATSLPVDGSVDASGSKLEKTSKLGASPDWTPSQLAEKSAQKRHPCSIRTERIDSSIDANYASEAVNMRK